MKMITSNQLSPGMTIKLGDRVYRVISVIKASVVKGAPFVKVKLEDLMTEKVIEKNFKLEENFKEVSLVEHTLEYLYPEGKDFLFLDVDNLKQVPISSNILKDKVNFLKEGIQIKAVFYEENVFSVKFPQFLELMIVKTDSIDERLKISSDTKKATLETGAVIDVPLFIEVGDIIKVDVYTGEYIQRV